MTTVSADIDKDLKAKLTSKATKEGKSISQLIKEGLNSLDLDKEESNQLDEEPKTRENITNIIREAVTPLYQKVGNIEEKINAIQEIDAEFCNIAKNLANIASKNKQKRIQLAKAITQNTLKIDKLNAHNQKDRRNIQSIRRDLFDAQHRLANKGVEITEEIAKQLK